MNKNKKRQNTKVKKTRPASALGTLVGKGVAFAKKLPVIGNVVDKIDTTASNILSFLGLADAFMVTYGLNGRATLTPRQLVNGFALAGTAAPGDILMKYYLSVGPEGSRTRQVSQLYEKYQLREVHLAVAANCAATEQGQIAYLFVPDPTDTKLDNMDPSSRLSSIMARENVQLAQIWQTVDLQFMLPNKEYFVNANDGVERLASPGVIYAIAVTACDTSRLPTLRQTSSYTFSRPTLNPLGDTLLTGTVLLQMKNLSVDGKGYWMDILPADNNGIANRKSTGTVLMGNTNVPVDFLAVKKGELVTVVSCCAPGSNGAVVSPLPTMVTPMPMFIADGLAVTYELSVKVSLLSNPPDEQYQKWSNLYSAVPVTFQFVAKETGKLYFVPAEFDTSWDLSAIDAAWTTVSCVTVDTNHDTGLLPTQVQRVDLTNGKTAYLLGVKNRMPRDRAREPIVMTRYEMVESKSR